MKNRLQIRYCKQLFTSREEAVSYINNKFGRNQESSPALIAEPLICFYGSNNDYSKAILAIGKKGDGINVLENALNEPYFIIDIEKSENDIKKILERLENIENCNSGVQEELDNTQTGCGLIENGSYPDNRLIDTNYLSKAISLYNADIILDKEIFSIYNLASDTKKSIEEETARAKEKENFIENKVDNEIVRAGQAENVLEDKINTEINERIRLDEELENEINNEQGLRASADLALGERIDNEKKSREASDNLINNRLDEEISTRENNISSLNRLLSTETENRISGDNSIVEKINNEESKRIEKDNELSAAISDETDKRSQDVIRLEGLINQNTGDIEKNKVISGNKTISIVNSLSGTDVSVNIDGKTIKNNENGIISVNVTPEDKILLTGAEGLSSIIGLSYDTINNTINLTGKDNTLISSIDARAFIKDGMVNDVKFNSETGILSIIFNTDSGKNTIDINLSELTSIYESGNGIRIISSEASNRIEGVVSNEGNEFLSVGPDGFKVSGVSSKINEKVEAEKNRALLAENNIISDLAKLDTKINQEKTDRISGDTITLSNSKSYTDTLTSELNGRLSTVEKAITTNGTIYESIKTNSEKIENNRLNISSNSEKITSITQKTNDIDNRLTTAEGTITEHGNSISTAASDIISINNRLTSMDNDIDSLRTNITNGDRNTLNDANKYTDIKISSLLPNNLIAKEISLTTPSEDGAKEQTLLRRISGSGHYYVTNKNSADNISCHTNSVLNDTTTVQNVIYQLFDKIAALEEKINNLENNAITSIEGTANQIKVEKLDKNKVKIGFSDNTVYMSDAEF